MRDRRELLGRDVWTRRSRHAGPTALVRAILIGICLVVAVDLAAVGVASAASNGPQRPLPTRDVPVRAGNVPRFSTSASIQQAVLAGTVADPRSGVSSTAKCPTGWFTIGWSVRARPIVACRLGSGTSRLTTRMAVIGAINGGWERNTRDLVEMLLNYYVANPTAIPYGLVVYFVPAVNPDGIALGTSSDSAWNARGVDLNRNFDSGNWSRDTYGTPGGRYGPDGVKIGGGGTAPFSEPETRAIRDFLQGRGIRTVISYHSGFVSVSAKDGGGGIGEPLAKLIARITGYPYIATWTAYKLTGQLVDWANRVGIKGIDIDLPSRFATDYSLNLAALKAVMSQLV
jgi:zinc carboxypeptidase